MARQYFRPLFAKLAEVLSAGIKAGEFRPVDPMQFIPSSWARYRWASGNPSSDINNPRDAIFAAAAYLRVAGAPGDLPRAIFAYNHADWYVDMVLRQMRAYGYRG